MLRNKDALDLEIGDVVESMYDKDTKFIVLETHPGNTNTTIVMQNGIIDSDSVDYGWISNKNKVIGKMDIRTLKVLYGSNKYIQKTKRN